MILQSDSTACMDYASVAVLVTSCDADIQQLINIGAIDPKVTNKGRTLICVKGILYKNFVILLKNGCPLVSLNDDNYLNIPNDNHLHKYLLENPEVNIDCSITNKYGMNFLHCYVTKPDILKLLLDKTLLKFDPNLINMSGGTISHSICRNYCNLHMVNKLVTLGANIDIKNRLGCTIQEVLDLGIRIRIFKWCLVTFVVTLLVTLGICLIAR